MRDLRGVLPIFVLLLPSGLVAGQQPENSRSSPRPEFFALSASDGRSHEIEAIALGRSAESDCLFFVEGTSDPHVAGVPKPTNGSYRLWTLDANGRVLHKTIISKMSSRQPPCVTILPLSLPDDGAVVVGMFDDQFGWRLVRVDGTGKVTQSVKLISEPSAFLGAALLPDAQGLLLAGQRGSIGSIWKVDLNGKVIWKKTYTQSDRVEGDHDNDKIKGDEQHDPRTKSSMEFNSIALIGDQGDFVAAGDFGEINKFGVGERSIWLVHCDREGNVVGEKSFFPGRSPTVCATGNQQCAILYDAGSGWEIDPRIENLRLDWSPVWKHKLELYSFVPDGPAMTAIPSGRGLVVAGANITIDKEKKQVIGWDCQVLAIDAKGTIATLDSRPVVKEISLFTHVACGASFAYVARRTKGMERDAKEAAIFAIPLSDSNQ